MTHYILSVKSRLSVFFIYFYTYTFYSLGNKLSLFPFFFVKTTVCENMKLERAGSLLSFAYAAEKKKKKKKKKKNLALSLKNSRN